MKRLAFKDLIIFEDQDILAINKPHGIATLEDRSEEICILNEIKKIFPDIQVCHRLDKDTSGVLVFAKNPETYRHISLQFQERQVKKIYHAIVHGQTEYDDYKVDLPLVIKGQGLVKWDAKSGKESSTYFTTLKNFKAFSLIKCMPVTGRRHQIRVHLKSCKHSIIADTMYDGELVYLSSIKRSYKQSQKEERPMINRMALHAFQISFESLDKKAINIEASYPKDFSILLKQLDKFGT